MAGNNVPAAWCERLKAGLQTRGIALSASASASASTTQALVQFAVLLRRWNRIHNLVAAGDAERLIERHVLDSLSLLSWLPPATQTSKNPRPRLIDLGSGAGLPVLPLALVRPDMRFLSIEANGKKANFQRQAIIELGLANVDLHAGRIESVTASAPYVTARALAPPARLLLLAEPFCEYGGRVLLMLGHAEQLPPVLPAGWHLESLEAVSDCDATRHVAVVVHQPTTLPDNAC